MSELLERKGAVQPGTGGEGAAVAQEVEPAGSGRNGHQGHGHAGDRTKASKRRVKLLALAAAMAVWLALGVHGVTSYIHDYYLYRGFAPPHDPVGIARGHLRKVKFFSPALGRESSYRIYLPPGYSFRAAAGQRFPVLYLLHGAPGWSQLFVNAGNLGVAMDTLVAHHRIRPFLVVLPDGRSGIFHTDTEWANAAKGRYEDYVIDTVRAVDARWPTIPRRTARALGGNSEGAYAAINIGLHHLGLFGILESWSGYFVQRQSGPFHDATPTMLYDNSPALYVSSMAGRLRRLPVHAFMYTGRKDHHRAEVESFARELRAAGTHVRFALYPGGHDWRLWREQTPRMLRYANRWFGRRAVPAPRVPTTARALEVLRST